MTTGGNDNQAFGELPIVAVDPQEGEDGVHDIEDEGARDAVSKTDQHHALMMCRNADM